MNVRTVTVGTAVCWTRGCNWHATGTDVGRVDAAACNHLIGRDHSTESGDFPLSGPIESLVDFHQCERFDKDRPETPGHSCSDG